jgi:hypothetical protein
VRETRATPIKQVNDQRVGPYDRIDSLPEIDGVETLLRRDEELLLPGKKAQVASACGVGTNPSFSARSENTCAPSPEEPA